MSTKTTTKQEQTGNSAYNNQNAYGYVQNPGSADIDALRNFQFSADPSIAYNTAQAKKQFNSQLDSPFAANYNPAIRSAIQRSGNASINQTGAEQASEANQALQGAQFGQKEVVAGMTAPQLVNTGSAGTGSSSGSGTGTQSTGGLGTILGPAIQGAASVGAAF